MSKLQRNAMLLARATSRAAAEPVPEDRAAAEALCRRKTALLGADAATLRGKLGNDIMPPGSRHGRYTDPARRSVGTSFTFNHSPLEPWALATAICVEVSPARRG